MAPKSVSSFLWKHIKPYKWSYALMLMAPILGGLYPMVGSYFLKIFINTISKSKIEYYDFVFPVAILLGNELFVHLIFRTSTIIASRTQPKVRSGILLDAYSYLQHHSYRFFQNNFSGTINTKIKGLLDGYNRFWEDMQYGLFLKTTRLIFCLAGLLWAHQLLGGLVLAWGIAFSIIMHKLYSGQHRKIVYEETQSSEKCLGRIGDRIANINTILSFATHDRELAYLKKELYGTYIPKQTRHYKSSLFISFVGSVLSFVAVFGFVSLLMWLAKNKLLNAGEIAFVGGLMFKFWSTLWGWIGHLSSFSKAMGNLKSSMSILKEAQEERDLPSAKPLKVEKPTVTFKNVSFTYGDTSKEIFENFNLTIKPGEKIGLVGSSGAGKSSLVKLLLRYFSCDSGEIYIDGQEISQVTQKSLRDQIAIVPQDTTLFHRSILENIVYGKPDATKEEVIKACKEAQIHDEIMALPRRYKGSAGEGGSKLSGGQKQRLIIARALLKLKRASILILDEASAALDSENEKALDRLISKTQKTVIAIAHRLPTIRNMDRIIVLENGKIIEEGTHTSLLAQAGSRYSKWWNHQVMANGPQD
ncbi:MAG: ABC transporter ATP-binding protein [Cytophagales bacterium]